MGFWYEGEVYIPLEDFYKFVHDYININGGMDVLGKIECEYDHIKVPIAVNTECRPLEQVGGVSFETICGIKPKGEE